MYIDSFSPQESKDIPVSIDVFAEAMRLSTIIDQFKKDMSKNVADFAELIVSGKEPTLKYIGAVVVRAARAIAVELSIPTFPDGEQPEIVKQLEQRLIRMEFRPTELFSKELIDQLGASDSSGELILSMIPAISAALKNSGCFSSVDVFTKRTDFSLNAMAVLQDTMLHIHVKLK